VPYDVRTIPIQQTLEIFIAVNINFYDFTFFLNFYLFLFLFEGSEDGQHRKPKYVIDSAAHTAVNFVSTVS
jgi:hypothetical protein